MKWEHTKRTAILGRALACGFFLTVLAGFFPFAAASEELPQNIVRLHVVANSDSEEDQAVKLLVRDAVLEEAARWYGGARTMEEASARLCTHLESIAKTAQATLREQGMGYSATAQVTEMYFPTRDYESFRLPAGRYRTLRVTLGEGAGKNWWCVVFPSLCLPAASGEEALLSLPEEQRRLVEDSQQCQVKLKAVELWEALREWLRG
ncbi:stage II sporulation protein R [Acutalibacter sp. LFL-21]|uniref:stage II sporulation protein R n=1 Tax=Acutalibacter sp. LFL-21 TaxID=2983399 RepID=UPI0015BA3D47|nr:stage II sporulation protein R [Acutalibacter sp. LFL-21]MCU7652246.1 stage II sporulation protein R [Acutalibacter sp. LFL-21]HIW22361.1 stage II sporulation protein R [Candidatus Acutalibacter stercoravium]